MKCPRCSLINPDTAVRCDCGWDFSTGTVQESYLGREAMLLNQLAPLSKRLTAQFIDELIAIAPALVGIILVTFSETFGTAMTFVGIAFAILYNLFADGLAGGQSYGKRLMKTAVIDITSGRPCTFMKSLVRNLLLMVLGIIDWIFIFGKKRQRLGDMAANTVVVMVTNR